MIAMSYNKYPKEMKEAIIARMLEGDETVTDIQRDTGVGINTLYRWRDQAKHQKGLSATTKYKNADKWSSQDKFMVVLETANLTEIEFSEYCREKGVYPEQVKEWKEACINANDNAREKNTKAGKELRAERKEKEKLEKELARKEKALAEAAALLVYKACTELGISKRTYNRWKNTDSDYIDKRTICARPEPANKLTKEERQEILDICNTEEFASKTPSEIVPILADRGSYIASESTFYKVLKEAKQLTHRGREQRKHKRPISTHKATRANQVWMWDITYLNGPIKGMHYYLYMFSDLYSRKIVGWEVWESEDAKHASELVKRIYRDEKIYIRNMQKEPLVLHSDNGSPMKGTTMLETLYALGITPSKSRPRVSNDNPYAESLFKTLKYVPNFQPQGFATLTEARLWVKRFVEWYNNEHRHSGINYVTPSQRHMGLDQEVLRKRKEVYEKAKERHPERWAKGTRAWSFSEEEWLNPRQEAETKKEAKVS